MANIVFVGPGRVGTAFALAFKATSHLVHCAIASQDGVNSDKAQQFEAVVGAPVVQPSEAIEWLSRADVVFFTVPDRKIQSVVQMYVDRGGIHAGQVVVHTSGALSSDVLGAVHRVGAYALSMHPLQMFASPERALELLRGATVTIEGDDEAIQQAVHWILEFDATCVLLDADMKARYHAAAVLASNALVALVGVAADLSGLPNGICGLLPLVRGAVSQLENVGVPMALTGPIERGDILTVERHLEALRAYPTAAAIYTALGQATIDMAVEKGSLTDEARGQLQKLLKTGR